MLQPFSGTWWRRLDDRSAIREACPLAEGALRGDSVVANKLMFEMRRLTEEMQELDCRVTEQGEVLKMNE